MRAVVRASGVEQVVLDCQIGQIADAWREASPNPEAGQLLDVEFDLDQVIRGADVIDAEDRVQSLAWDANTDQIVGCLESVDDDWMGCLRLAVDCLVLMGTDGSVLPGQWIQLRVPSSSVEIYGGTRMY